MNEVTFKGDWSTWKCGSGSTGSGSTTPSIKDLALKVKTRYSENGSESFVDSEVVAICDHTLSSLSDKERLLTALKDVRECLEQNEDKDEVAISMINMTLEQVK